MIIIKFITGDEIDKKVVKVTVHEFFRCTLAFNSFIVYGPQSTEELDNPKIKQSLLRYNAYSLFVQHLYEYFVSCVKRERKDTRDIPGDEVDILIVAEVDKILRNWLISIDNGYAPSWANSRSYYETPCPKDFGNEFRNIRNSLSHADYRRIHGGNRITLSDFYKKYHMYVMLLYDNGIEWWSIENFDEIELGDITEFNILINKKD
ncbi:hypothetical protein [Psychrobacillus antarcticus]|uniref:hypothetical protein n=1 Tax=Psychrobacillus antarcticus TaxID=2879115 RepID=UPI0024088B41|nr:hypothetical protein [Psychrobacillus antarcticus]